MFEIGNKVICTGWDDLHRYNGYNILDCCGFKKDEQLTIVDIMDDLLIFENPSGAYADKVCLKYKHFTSVSSIRDTKLLTILT